MAVVRAQEAASLNGKSFTTIWRAIKSSRLSAARTKSSGEDARRERDRLLHIIEEHSAQLRLLTDQRQSLPYPGGAAGADDHGHDSNDR